MKSKYLQKTPVHAFVFGAVLTGAPTAHGYATGDNPASTPRHETAYVPAVSSHIDLDQIERNDNISRLAATGLHLNSNWNTLPVDHELSRSLSLALHERAFNVQQLRDDTLDELGSIAGDQVKKLILQFKETSPGAFSGMLAGGTLAAGTYGYLNGSDSLEDYGVKPAWKSHYLQDQLSVKFEPTWGPRFATVGFKTAIGFNRRIGHAGHFQSELSMTDRGVQQLSLSYRLNVKDRTFLFRATGNHNFQSGASSARVSLQYQPMSNVDMTCIGNINSQGETRLGLGLTYRF